jgi:5'-nucleotidase
MNGTRGLRLRRVGALLALAIGLGLAAGGGTAAGIAAPGTVDLQLLSFNDFHGNLQPPTGADGLLVTAPGQPEPSTAPAGGVEYLTTHLRRLRQGHPRSLTVAAGDLIGGSPFLSGLFKDEPSVESLNTLGLDLSSVGNHEFDEGVPELLRMQYGGCHPVEGCFDADGFSGARYRYLAANVAYKDGVSVSPPAGAPRYGVWWRSRPGGRTVLPPRRSGRWAG